MRACATIAVAASITLWAPGAWADGGVPIASVVSAAGSWTLMVRPAQPAVGPVEFDLIGPGAQDAVFELEEEGGRPEVVVSAAGPDPRLAHLRTDLRTAGRCVVRVRVPNASQTLEAVLQVAPEAPGVMQRLPWLLAWIPMSALLVARAVASRARSYTASRT